MTSQPDSATIAKAVQHAQQNADTFEQQLFELLRIPSVSTVAEHAADCRAAATLLADDLRRIGMDNAQVLETEGLPMVYAEWLHAGSNGTPAPTVLVYGHYDVQPPDPVEEWNTPPFEPTVIDGAVYARGACDN